MAGYGGSILQVLFLMDTDPYGVFPPVCVDDRRSSWAVTGQKQ
jgi:hypothetical protein